MCFSETNRFRGYESRRSVYMDPFFEMRGGYQEMCEVSEKIYNEGKIEDKMETAFNMKKKGYSDDVIAGILEVGLNVIQRWLAEVSVARS